MAPSNVRFRGQSGQHLLAVSLSAYDPKLTTRDPDQSEKCGSRALIKAESKMEPSRVTAAAAVVMTVPLLVGTTSARAQNLKMAQGVDVQLGRDRDDRDHRRRNDSDVTIGVGPGGVTVGPRRNCRMVTTTVERDDGRTITRKERRCD
jgi:hypothetical protein